MGALLVELRATSVAGGAAVVADHQARDVDGLEVGERKTCKAREIGIVPTGIGSSDQAAAQAIVGEDDPVVPESGDDDCRLWTCGRTRGCRNRSFEAIDFARSSGHGATCRGRRF